MKSGASTSVIVLSSLIEHVQRRAGGVLEGVADRVADDGGLVRLGALAEHVAVLVLQAAGLDELLGVVPGATAVVQDVRHQDAGHRADHQQAAPRPPGRRMTPITIGRADGQDAGEDHLAQRGARADVDATRVVGLDVPGHDARVGPNWRRTSSIMPWAARPTARMAREENRKISIAPMKPPMKTCGLRQVDVHAAVAVGTVAV